MTEADYLASSDPQAMLEHLLHGVNADGDAFPCVTDRKLRMFACACSGLAGIKPQILDAYEQDGCPEDAFDERLSDQAWAMQWASWRTTSKARTPCPPEAVRASLLRDIFGNVFRPVGVRHFYAKNKAETWELPQSWLTSTVVSLAQAIYDERAFDRMWLLAEALEDAGCTDEAVLQHCRAKVGRTVAEVIAEKCTVVGCCNRHADNMGCDCLEEAKGNIGPHVRGCHVLDTILGKS